MSHLLILARNDASAYRSPDGHSLLAGLPFEVTLFADHGNGFGLRALEGEHEIEVVHWSDEPGVVARAMLLHTGVPFTAVTTFDEQLAALAGQVRSALGLAAGAAARAAPVPPAIRKQALLDAAAVQACKPVFPAGHAGKLLH